MARDGGAPASPRGPLAPFGPPARAGHPEKTKKTTPPPFRRAGGGLGGPPGIRRAAPSRVSAARSARATEKKQKSYAARVSGERGRASRPFPRQPRENGIRIRAKLVRQFAGRPLTIETGKMARQADGSCTLMFGETMVLCAATAQDNATHLPFFPLTVEYRERTYAAGKFPGGFIKREGRPSDKEILSARLVDRPLRPLFPDGFANETQVFVTVVSADQENDADVLGITGASMSLMLSRIPFAGPIAAVRIGRIQGQWVLNPTFQQLEYSELDIIVAGSADAIMMVEGGALEVPEETIAEGLAVAHQGIKELVQIQLDLMAEVEIPAPMEWTPKQVAPEFRARLESLAGDRLRAALMTADKAERNAAIKAVKAEVIEQLLPEYETADKDAGEVLKDIEKRAMREMILSEGVRSDGRDTDTVRPITIEVGVLPRTHGSALF